MWCSSPVWQSTGDYDLVDRLVWRLRQRTGVTYRIAYMVGSEGSIGAGRCRFYQGDTVLYNPRRLSNLTAIQDSSRPQVAHNDPLLGFQLRRSLPLCNRGTKLLSLETLIDGPPQTDKCGRLTPGGRAWMLRGETRSGNSVTPATMVRFALVGVPGSSFDFFTVHPPNDEETIHQPALEGFINALTSFSRRGANPYYPPVVVGDFNALVRQAWPPGMSQLFAPPEDVMAVAVGQAESASAARSLKLISCNTLPGETPCRPSDRSFSDHCGLFVRLGE
jgi:hypothetical protein